jgi:(p)ppGpp synthase/HD superfamily hydrolase
MARTDFVERSPLTRDALNFANERHAGQTRDLDDLPFVTHPVEVACLLHEAGYPDAVVAAGVLHDVLEDTDAERSELESRFGARVAELVDAVSDDPSRARASTRPRSSPPTRSPRPASCAYAGAAAGSCRRTKRRWPTTRPAWRCSPR